MTAPLLVVDDLVCTYPGRSREIIRAVNGVSFALMPGETLAIVGESGSGKSTLARALVRLSRPASGSVRFDGADLASIGGPQLRAMRRRFQIVFQDPFTSLNPRLTAGEAVAEGLEIHGMGAREARDARVASLFTEVGIDPSRRADYPHTFSGGERQRLALARALAVDPELLVLDEPVSALDVLVRAEVLALLRQLQQARGLACIFIGHDLATVAQVAQRIAVMYAGRIVEIGPAAAVLATPAHPYTKALRSAVPAIDPADRVDRIVLGGSPPSPKAAAPGCAFAPRCWWPGKNARCTAERPELQLLGDRHVACHFPPPMPHDA
jgi:oligopeptide/dipeptide ABC transporter ATP-binding protein